MKRTEIKSWQRHHSWQTLFCESWSLLTFFSAVKSVSLLPLCSVLHFVLHLAKLPSQALVPGHSHARLRLTHRNKSVRACPHHCHILDEIKQLFRLQTFLLQIMFLLKLYAVFIFVFCFCLISDASSYPSSFIILFFFCCFHFLCF